MTTVAALAAHRTMAFADSACLRDQAAGKTIQPSPPQQDEDGELDSNHFFVAGQLKRIAGDFKRLDFLSPEWRQTLTQAPFLFPGSDQQRLGAVARKGADFTARGNAAATAPPDVR